MLISLKTLDGKTFEIEVEENDSILSLKEKVEMLAGNEYPANRQQLIYAGKTLLNRQLIQDCSIDEKKSLVIFVNKPQDSQEGSSNMAPVMESMENEKSESNLKLEKLAKDISVPSVNIQNLDKHIAKSTLALRDDYAKRVSQFVITECEREDESVLPANCSNQDMAVEYGNSNNITKSGQKEVKDRSNDRKSRIGFKNEMITVHSTSGIICLEVCRTEFVDTTATVKWECCHYASLSNKIFYERGEIKFDSGDLIKIIELRFNETFKMKEMKVILQSPINCIISTFEAVQIILTNELGEIKNRNIQKFNSLYDAYEQNGEISWEIMIEWLSKGNVQAIVTLDNEDLHDLFGSSSIDLFGVNNYVHHMAHVKNLDPNDIFIAMEKVEKPEKEKPDDFKNVFHI